MTVQYNNQLTDEQYRDKRYNTLLWLETVGGQVDLTAYTDSAGYPTIGAGFKIDSNWKEILDGMGFDTTNGAPAAEKTYIKLIEDLIPPNSDKKFTTSEMATLNQQLNTIMQARYDYYVSIGDNTKRQTFSFTDAAEVETTFQVIADKREEILRTWLGETVATQYAIVPRGNERIALLSLVYNNIIGPGKSPILLNDIKNGNRAEAWYEIRYNSNKNDENGIAKRRFFEAEMFGLYNDPAVVSTDDAQQVYRMLQKHRTDIADKEAKYGVAFDGTPGIRQINGQTVLQAANNDYDTSLLTDGTIDTLEASLNSAKTVILTDLRTQYASNPDLVAKLQDTSFKSTDIYLNPSKPTDDYRGSVMSVSLFSINNNSLMIGMDQTDYMFGGNGNDVLIGDAGNDYIAGGLGNDYIEGGIGNDIYIINTGDGQDTITDSDSIGTIIYDGKTVLSGLHKNSDPADTWQGTNGEILTRSGNDLVITKTGPTLDSITVKNYFSSAASNPLGIKLTDETGYSNLPTSTIDMAALNINSFIAGQDSPTDTNYIVRLNNNGDYVQIDHTDDQIYGGTGDDTVYAGDGNDRIYGGAGDDTLSGDNNYSYIIDGQDYIEGGDGNDIIAGGYEDDILIGGAGNDIIAGEYLGGYDAYAQRDPAKSTGASNDDYIDGGDGDDVLVGGLGNDTIIGGAGNDQIDGDLFTTGSSGTIHPENAGNDTIDAGAGSDIVYGYGGNDIIFGGAGSATDNDYIDGGDGDDTIIGGSGTNTIIGGGGDDYIQGGAGDGNNAIYGGGGNDDIIAGAGNDYIDGGAGDDTIDGGDGGNTLLGADGNDTIVGGSGGDYIDGGAGDDAIDSGQGDNTSDTIYGGDGSDTYIFGRGSGQDIIIDSSGTDTIQVADDVNPDDITTVRLGNDLYLVINDTSDILQINDWFTSDANKIESIQFGDGTVWDGSALISMILQGTDGDDTVTGSSHNDNLYGFLGNDTLAGGRGNDTLDGGAGDDAYIFNIGDGVDTITDRASLAEGNRIVFGAGITPGDLKLSYQGDALIITIGANGDALYLKGFNPNDIYGAHAVESFEFDDGTILSYSQLIDRGFNITATTGDNVITTGAGDDVITVGDGNNFISAGDGNNTIGAGDGSNVITTGTGDDVITVGNRTNTINAGDGNNIVNAGDGTYDIQTGNGDDIITVGAGNSIIFAGNGNNIINTGGGNNLITAGAGNDVITVSDGRNTIMAGGGNDTIYGGLGNDTIIGEEGDDWIDGGKGDDYLGGGDGNDTYIFGRGSGHDFVSDNGGTDTIQFASDVNPDDITTLRQGDNLSFVINDTGDTLQVGYWFTSDANKIKNIRFGDGTVWDGSTITAMVLQGTEWDDVLTGTDSGEIINGLGGNDIIFAGGGNDTINGGAGNDTIDGGEGDDIIYGVSGDNTYRSIQYADILNEAQTKIAEIENNLIDGVYFIGEGNPFPQLPPDAPSDIRAQFDAMMDTGLAPGEAQAAFQSLLNWLNYGGQGADSNDYIYGGAGNDILMGGSGNDQIYGGDGDDMIDGRDNADMLDGGAGNDVISGGAGNDEIAGFYGDDVLEGGEGDDILIGEEGNDILMGGSGNDTYIFSRGYGQDIIIDSDITTGNVDTIFLDGDIQPSDVSLQRSGDDLVLSINGTDDALTVSGWFSGDENKIEQVQFADGTTWDAAAIENMLNVAPVVGTPLPDQMVAQGTPLSLTIPAGTFTDQDIVNGDILTYGASFADGTPLPLWLTFDAVTGTFSGTAGMSDLGVLPIKITATDTGGLSADVYFNLTVANMITGSIYNDTINGTAGLDYIQAGAGNDTVNAGEGNDIIDGGAGNDVLAGGSGDDTFLVSGTDTSYDRFQGDAGYDTIQGTDADDTIRVNNFSGAFTVEKIDGGLGTNVIAGTQYNDTVDLSGTQLINIANIDGGAGNDTITGSAGNDNIIGGAGSDVLAGGSGDDTFLISGTDTGYDRFQGDLGYDTVQGTDADDTIRVNNFSGTYTVEKIDGGLGTNVIAGTQYNDTMDLSGTELVNIANIDGGTGNDTITGSAGNDNIIGGAGSDVLSGGSGDDTFLISGTDTGYDRFQGDAGYDVIQGSDSDDTIRMNNFTGIYTVEKIDGRLGVNSIAGTQYNDSIDLSGTELVNIASIDGGAGNDVITGSAGNDTIIGGAGSDVLAGGAGDDTFLVNGTDTSYDRFQGNAGYDVIQGGDGDDIIRVNNFSSAYTVEKIDGGLGTNVIAGTQYNDTIDLSGTELANIANIDGGAGNDTITGSVGNDTIIGGAGSDVLSGGAGDDTFLVSGTDTSYDRFQGDLGYDTVQGGAGDDTIRVNNFSGTYTVEKIDGGLGTNVIAGTQYNDTIDLSGTQLINIANIDGGAGNDTITGSAGNDTIIGGTGNDSLKGGMGNDAYLFGIGGGTDTINDYDTTAGNEDTVQISVNPLDLIFSKSGTNLVMGINGTTDQITVQNWYSGSSYQTEQFHASDGSQLLNTQVDQLIQAMATFTSNNGISWSQAIQNRPQDVQQILAQYWAPQT